MRLAENGWRIKHVPVRAIYTGQRSGIKVSTFLPKVSLMLLIGLHFRIIRNTIKKPSTLLVITWATYLTGWLYHPVAFLIAHISDRVHVRNILRDTR